MFHKEVVNKLYRGGAAAIALILAIALLGLGVASPSFAQSPTTTLLGTVTDKEGGVVSKAQVTATNVDTNFTRTAPTNEEGEYRIEFLPLGNYKVEVAATGFKKTVQTGVVLEVGVVAHADAKLEVGDVNQSVTVTAEMPAMNTTSADVGRLVENKEIIDLPIVNRNVYALLSLTAGVESNANSIVLGYPEQRTLINGGVDGGAGSVSYYLDGGINMTGLRNTGNILPNPDAIQEFQVETNNYNAQYGKASGGVVTVVTKSGTNAWHGSAFDFYRDTVLNANVWNNTTGIKPPIHRNQYGGTVGGPIRKDKDFIFFSYQGLAPTNQQLPERRNRADSGGTHGKFQRGWRHSRSHRQRTSVHGQSDSDEHHGPDGGVHPEPLCSGGKCRHQQMAGIHFQSLQHRRLSRQVGSCANIQDAVDRDLF